MPVSQLTPTTTISGTFSASGVTAPFSAPAPLYFMTFGFLAQFSPDATGTISITKSTNGGSTFAPIAAGNLIISSLSGSGQLNIQWQSGAQYRVECSLSGGSIGYKVSNTIAPSDIGIIDGGFWFMEGVAFDKAQASGTGTAPTSAQKEKLKQAAFTPLAPADIAGTVTLYKAATYGTVANSGAYTVAGPATVTLSVPAAALRVIDLEFQLGARRTVRVEYADVIAIVDQNGNALTNAYSISDPPALVAYQGNNVKHAGTAYAVGQRTFAMVVDPNNPTASGTTSVDRQSFPMPSYRPGLYCYPTLIEAACNPQLRFVKGDGPPSEVPNLTALGL